MNTHELNAIELNNDFHPIGFFHPISPSRGLAVARGATATIVLRLPWTVIEMQVVSWTQLSDQPATWTQLSDQPATWAQL